jgi:hypothetical protein
MMAGRRCQKMKPRDRNLWQAVPLVFLLLVGILMVCITASYYNSKATPEVKPSIGSDRLLEEP